MFDQLLDVLNPKAVGQDVFTGANMHPEAQRVYGGQVLAQCISAAVATVPAARALHSQHAYFLRPGNPTLPIELEVERARDGGSFSSRRVVASQGGKTILVSSLSFQEASRGDDFQTPAPSAPEPEELASMRELSLAAGDLNEDFTIIAGGDLDVRMAEPIDWENPVPREPNLQVWMRAMGTVTGEQAENRGLHQALLAYMSDAFLIDVCMVVHGRSFMNTSMQVASLDHALWFHDDFRADEWLLHTVEAKRVSGGRGLAYGNFYTREGKLVASTMQQGLMRFV